MHPIQKYLDFNKGSAPGTYTAFLKVGFFYVNSVELHASRLLVYSYHGHHIAKVFEKCGRIRKPLSAPTNMPAVDGWSTEEFSVPSLEEMGYDPITPPQVVNFPGGETSGLDRMVWHIVLRFIWLECSNLNAKL